MLFAIHLRFHGRHHCLLQTAAILMEVAITIKYYSSLAVKLLKNNLLYQKGNPIVRIADNRRFIDV